MQKLRELLKIDRDENWMLTIRFRKINYEFNFYEYLIGVSLRRGLIKITFFVAIDKSLEINF